MYKYIYIGLLIILKIWREVIHHVIKFIMFMIYRDHTLTYKYRYEI